MNPRPAISSESDPPAKLAGLNAALTLFVRHGVEATSVRDIAAHSGYTNPAIFKHFETKAGLALYLFERCYVWMAKEMATSEAQCGENADPVRRILAIAACMLRLMDQDIEAVLLVQENLRQFWRETAPATRSVSLLGRMRVLSAAALNAQGGQPSLASPNLIASSIVGLLGQIAREAYF